MQVFVPGIVILASFRARFVRHLPLGHLPSLHLSLRPGGFDANPRRARKPIPYPQTHYPLSPDPLSLPAVPIRYLYPLIYPL